MKSDAVLSKCRKYRYALWRSWDDTKPQVMFIGLNPSSADECRNDPTLIRCINFAQSWGYGSVCTANLFAFRATKPTQMMTASDPVGRENNRWLKRLSAEATLIVAAWGNDGRYKNRSTAVRKLIADLHYLKLNQSGEPAHPLYLKHDLKPMPLAGY